MKGGRLVIPKFPAGGTLNGLARARRTTANQADP